jgi:hypothetical protein
MYITQTQPKNQIIDRRYDITMNKFAYTIKNHLYLTHSCELILFQCCFISRFEYLKRVTRRIY